ncbi:hypothetical protein ACP2W0_12830 [Pseudobacillus badius]|uniref:hypothetical protein n=1 Tax=Bacillus badius TaxID=1455 RepID=UPI003CEBC571
MQISRNGLKKLSGRMHLLGRKLVDEDSKNSTLSRIEVEYGRMDYQSYART